MTEQGQLKAVQVRFLDAEIMFYVSCIELDNGYITITAEYYNIVTPDEETEDIIREYDPNILFRVILDETNTENEELCSITNSDSYELRFNIQKSIHEVLSMCVDYLV